MSAKTEPDRDNVILNVAKMFNNPLFSDVTIKVFDVEIHAHQFIICVQNEYFKKAFHKPESLPGTESKTSGFTESESMVIEFTEGSGPAYWRVFEYMYTGDYTELLSTAVFHDDPDFVKHVRVYLLADMFLMNDLKALATTKLENALQNFGMTRLYADCAREVYAGTISPDSALRKSVVRAGIRKVREMGKKQAGQTQVMVVLDLDYMKDLIRDCGEFAVDFCRSYM